MVTIEARALLNVSNIRPPSRWIDSSVIVIMIMINDNDINDNDNDNDK